MRHTRFLFIWGGGKSDNGEKKKKARKRKEIVSIKNKWVSLRKTQFWKEEAKRDRLENCVGWWNWEKKKKSVTRQKKYFCSFLPLSLNFFNGICRNISRFLHSASSLFGLIKKLVCTCACRDRKYQWTFTTESYACQKVARRILPPCATSFFPSVFFWKSEWNSKECQQAERKRDKKRKYTGNAKIVWTKFINGILPRGATSSGLIKKNWLTFLKEPSYVDCAAGHSGRCCKKLHTLITCAKKYRWNEEKKKQKRKIKPSVQFFSDGGKKMKEGGTGKNIDYGQWKNKCLRSSFF